MVKAILKRRYARVMERAWSGGFGTPPWQFNCESQKREAQKKCKTQQVKKQGRKKTGAAKPKAKQKEIHKESLFAYLKWVKQFPQIAENENWRSLTVKSH